MKEGEKVSEGEGKAISMMDKMTPEQQKAAQKAFAKQQAVDMVAYKKRLRDGNELKRLQVEELQLNNTYFEQKKKWLEVQPELQEMEAKEQAEIQKQRVDREKLIKEQEKAAIKKKTDEAVVIPKQEKKVEK